MAKRRVGILGDQGRAGSSDGMTALALSGIGSLLPFMAHLERRGIWFTLEHQRADAVTMVIHLVGERIEAEFFADHIEYSLYRGNEDVLDGSDQIMGLIEARTQS